MLGYYADVYQQYVSFKLNKHIPIVLLACYLFPNLQYFQSQYLSRPFSGESLFKSFDKSASGSGASTLRPANRDSYSLAMNEGLRVSTSVKSVEELTLNSRMADSPGTRNTTLKSSEAGSAFTTVLSVSSSKNNSKKLGSRNKKSSAEDEEAAAKLPLKSGSKKSVSAGKKSCSTSCCTIV